MGDQDVMGMRLEADDMEPVRPKQEPEYPMYPVDQKEEAHHRVAQIQQELEYMDSDHEKYLATYHERRTELITMMEMAHATIAQYENQYGPPAAPMPMSKAPGSIKDVRSAYDTGLRPPRIRQ
jgi:hypothetical protein